MYGFKKLMVEFWEDVDFEYIERIVSGMVCLGMVCIRILVKVN